jgi:putative membrane protein
MKLFTLLALASAGGLCACESGNHGMASDTYRSPSERADGASASASSAENARNDAASRDQSIASADTRILSILHAKNLEEIKIGKLARDKGASDDVRNFGQTLIQDHQQCENQVRQVSEAANAPLLEPKDMNDMLAREKGMSEPPQDPAEELASLEGAAFDQQFARMMVMGHRELIQIVQNARPSVQNARVAQLLDETLPILKHHEQLAADIVGH